mmetsp:Transcript_38574/g.44060  ORF Transcript_38574/g.44060 Transcript_38574/m.44060 type:complete len:91 (-) Transcript_38574:5-277(-)
MAAFTFNDVRRKSEGNEGVTFFLFLEKVENGVVDNNHGEEVDRPFTSTMVNDAASSRVNNSSGNVVDDDVIILDSNILDTIRVWFRSNIP